jgi:hypothetical protein
MHNFLTLPYTVKNLPFFPGFFPYQKEFHPFIVREDDPGASSCLLSQSNYPLSAGRSGPV